MTQSLQILSGWHLSNTAFLVYLHSRNSSVMSRILQCIFFCPQWVLYGVAPTYIMDNCSLLSFCHMSLSCFFSLVCFCITFHLSGISHSLLNCHLQPLAYILHFAISTSALCPSWLSHENYFPEVPALTWPLNPSFSTCVQETLSSIRVFAETPVCYLPCTYLLS